MLRRLSTGLAGAPYGRAGTRVFEKGEDAAHSYIVAAGMVQEYKMMPDGRRIITAFPYPGERVGLTFGACHSCSAEAATHAVLRREHLISTERNGWTELLNPEALTEIAEGD